MFNIVHFIPPEDGLHCHKKVLFIYEIIIATFSINFTVPLVANCDCKGMTDIYVSMKLCTCPFPDHTVLHVPNDY